MPSAPGGLQSLGKDSSSKISGTSTSDKHDERSEKPLVLPPEVSATLEAILESNADGHLDISSSTVRKLAVQSPFSAANGVVETKGRPLKFALTAQYRKPSHPFQVTNLFVSFHFQEKRHMSQLSCIATSSEPQIIWGLKGAMRKRAYCASMSKSSQTHVSAHEWDCLPEPKLDNTFSQHHGLMCA